MSGRCWILIRERCGTGSRDEPDRVESGRSPAPRSAESEEVRALRRRVVGAGTRPERNPQDLGRVFRPGGARPPTQMIVDYIDSHRGRFGVEPICAVLAEAGIQIAPSTYYTRREIPGDRRRAGRRLPGQPVAVVVAGQLGRLRGPIVVACGPSGRPRHRPRPGGPADEGRRDRQARSAGSIARDHHPTRRNRSPGIRIWSSVAGRRPTRD